MSEQQLEVKEFDHPPLPKNWLRTVVIIWLGQAASILTAYSSIYAGVWFVTETTDSALMLALASLCSMLPQGLLAPLGGVVADRFNRKYVLIAADAFVGTMALIMGMIIAMCRCRSCLSWARCAAWARRSTCPPWNPRCRCSCRKSTWCA